MQRCFSFQAVEDWLRCLGLLHYAQSFYDNGYEDLDTVKKIREKDLDAIGMLNGTDRDDILKAVEELDQNVYFELKPDEDASLFRSKIEKWELKGLLKKCIDRDKLRLKDGSVADLYPLAIRYAAELSTLFDDVRDLLEELREEEKDLIVTKKDVIAATNSPLLAKKNGSPTPTGKVVKISNDIMKLTLRLQTDSTENIAASGGLGLNDEKWSDRFISMDELRSEVFLQTAKKKYGKHAGNSIFTKIINKESQARLIYEDEQCIVFHDHNPQAPVHFLVVPRLHIPGLNEVKSDDKQLLGHLMYVANQCAQRQGLDKSGYRVVVDNKGTGDNSAGVRHLHVHVMGGRDMDWPPG